MNLYSSMVDELADKYTRVRRCRYIYFKTPKIPAEDRESTVEVIKSVKPTSAALDIDLKISESHPFRYLLVIVKSAEPNTITALNLQYLHASITSPDGEISKTSFINTLQKLNSL